MKQKWQKVGIGLLALAGILGWIGKFGFGWIAFGLTGLITAACAIRNKVGEPTRTVSQVIQDFTEDKPMDYAIGAAIIGFAAQQYFTILDKINIEELTNFELGMIMAFWPLIIGLSIHFFANKN